LRSGFDHFKLGPIGGWGKKFREGYDMACQADGDTPVAVDQFLASVQEHVDMRRQILSRGVECIACHSPHRRQPMPGRLAAHR